MSSEIAPHVYRHLIYDISGTVNSVEKGWSLDTRMGKKLILTFITRYIYKRGYLDIFERISHLEKCKLKSQWYQNG